MKISAEENYIHVTAMFLRFLIIVCFLASTLSGSELCFNYVNEYVCLDGANLRRVKIKNTCFDEGNLAGCSSIWRTKSALNTDGFLTSQSLASCLRSCHGDSQCLGVHYDQQGACVSGHLTLNESSDNGVLFLRTELNHQSIPCLPFCPEVALNDLIQKHLCLIPFCQECSEEDKCRTCFPGFDLDSTFKCDVSALCPLSNCLMCLNKTKCLLCEDGYSTNHHGQCEVLTCDVPNCQMCLTSNKCFLCDFGYVLSLESTCRVAI